MQRQIARRTTSLNRSRPKGKPYTFGTNSTSNIGILGTDFSNSFTNHGDIKNNDAEFLDPFSCSATTSKIDQFKYTIHSKWVIHGMKSPEGKRLNGRTCSVVKLTESHIEVAISLIASSVYICVKLFSLFTFSSTSFLCPCFILYSTLLSE